MVRQNSPTRNQTETQKMQDKRTTATRRADFDVQQGLERLEEMILESPRIPLTRQTLIDEDKFLEHLDLVRMNLPEAFEKALAVLQQQEELMGQAEDYAEKMLQSAQQRAAQILDETGIVQQAELEAQQIRRQVQQECETIQRQTLAEIEQMRRAVQQELQQLQQQTFAECQQMKREADDYVDYTKNGADDYADAVLNNIEQQLNAMMRVIQNGRQQLQDKSS